MKPLYAVQVTVLFTLLSTLATAGDIVVQPGSTALGASLSYTSYDEFYRGDTLQPEVPGGGDIEITSFRLYAETGLRDGLSVDVSAGYAESKSGVTEDDDFTDVYLGVNWQVADQEADFADMKLRAGVTIAGDYETGRLSALGDGENALDLSIAGRHFFNESLCGNLETGFTINDGDVPNAIRFRAGPQYELGGGFAVDASGIYFKGLDGIDIGGPGFSGPVDLPKVEEEGLVGELGLTASGNYGYYRFSVSHLFDGANVGEELTFGVYTGFTF